MTRVGVIGAGRIAVPVIDFLSDTPFYELVGVVARTGRSATASVSTTTIEAFLSREPDLILELASPEALAAYGSACLSVADLWTVNGVALADLDLTSALVAVGARFGRRLRLMPGAIAGLDGVAAAFRDPQARLTVTIQRPGLSATMGLLFAGSVREAARRFPHETNVAVAAAWAGSGLDETTVELVSAPADGPHRLVLEATGRGGRIACSVDLRPDTFAGHHPVAASVIAALEREARTIWAG